MDKVPVPAILKDFSRFFTVNGFQVFLVGGAVRDLFLEKKAEDWDVATNALPEEVATLFKRIIPTGIEHGTVTIPFREKMIECTTFRTETGFSDGRRPDSVSFHSTIEEDLARRDFTMNAIAVSLPEGNIVDPFGGRTDIKAGIIRSVGNAAERFSEDGLRPLRAVRFASQLGFMIDGPTLSAIEPALPVTSRVARERIRDELIKILVSPVPSKALRFMEITRLLRLILPELAACRGIEQKGMHRHDVLDHLLASCDAAKPVNLELRLAALLHDIGKPRVRAIGPDGQYTFHNHEAESERITASIMERLRFSLKTQKKVCHLVSQHMFHYESTWTDAAVRRFIVRVGLDHITDLFALRRADSTGINGTSADPLLLAEFQDRIDSLLEMEHAFKLKDLKVNGNDLLAAGLTAGPQTGLILNELLEAVLEDPSLNTRERLLEIGREIIVKRK